MNGDAQGNYIIIITGGAPKTRKRNCLNCPGCKRKDCGSCANCKDMVKFGGKGRKKQRCLYRVCTQKKASNRGQAQRGMSNNYNNQERVIILTTL